MRDKAPGRLYFFYGEEAYLKGFYTEKLRKMLVDSVTESFNFHKFTNENFSMPAFAECVENMPMMAEHTLIFVDDINIFKLDESEREKLALIFSDIPDYCTVVFTYETVEWKPDKRLKKLWSAVEKYGILVEFAKQDRRELITWAARHFSAAGKTITNELCGYLVDLTGGTMTNLGSEIDKICAYSGAAEIVKSDIDTVVEPVLDAVVFQMTDALGAGNTELAMQKLRDLLKMQEEPIAVLGAIGGHFRRLSAARVLLDNGKTPNDLMYLFGMPDFAARKMFAAAGKVSTSTCRQIADILLETDMQMKSSFDSTTRLLEIAFLRIARELYHG